VSSPNATAGSDATANGGLTVSKLNKSYESAAGSLTILNGVDLTAAVGEAIAITGPSGAGKSTLLYIIGLLEAPTGGTVRLAGQDPFSFDPKAQAKYRNEQVGFVFQDHHLLPQCTVLENVLIPTLANGASSAAASERAIALLERVGLKERLDHRPAQLSGGERQRAAVCRALINEPTLLLADEPTGNLDRRTAAAVGDLLLEMAREQHTILLCVTHSQDLAERFPRRYELVDGALVAR
jgi:lipoprotein-releasing system ATP-binding protein